MLCSVDDLLFTDVSGQLICPIFKGQAVQEECSLVPGSRHTFRLLILKHTRDHISLGGLPECSNPAAQLSLTGLKRQSTNKAEKTHLFSLQQALRRLEHPSCHTNKICKFQLIYFTRSEFRTSFNVII